MSKDSRGEDPALTPERESVSYRRRVSDPALTPEEISSLLDDPLVLSDKNLLILLLCHPRMTPPLLLKKLSLLSPLDLARIAHSPTASPMARTMTMEQVLQHYETIPLGTRKSLARLVPPAFFRRAKEEDGSVLAELLNNPRITEDILIQILQRRDLPRSFLVRLLGDSRWRNRSRVLFLLVQRGVAGEEVLSRLSRAQLEELSRNAALPQALKERVKELLRRFSPLRG
ncbi:MAG TPA: hypothetical protein PKW96_07025 [Candidatus Aminicenantes bacterium]|nr:hypothetical protein [Candidatus Aminicenantes bacterium]HPT00280.1 hypothetical protein [Candidatus Aminicenantes bacterium]